MYPSPEYGTLYRASVMVYCRGWRTMRTQDRPGPVEIIYPETLLIFRYKCRLTNWPGLVPNISDDILSAMATATQDLAQENTVYKSIALELHGRNYTD